MVISRIAFAACVVCASASVNAADEQESSYRTWTQRGGQRQASAAVTAVDGETVKLRKANGKAAVTRLADLSDADRQYIATWQAERSDRQKQATASSSASAEPFPVVSGVLSRVWNAASQPATAQKLQATDKSAIFPLLAAQSDDPPAELVHVRVSSEFLRQRVERAIERQSVVRDNILGTEVHGWATTTGRTGVRLEPSEDRALLSITFAGTIRSQTVGYNGPAVLHTRGETWFRANSQLVLSDQGVIATPARATARTNNDTYDIEATVPGLRGRIVERVARRRCDESRQQSEYIAAQKASGRIAAALDKEMQAAAASIRQTLVDNVQKLAAEDGDKPSVRFRSTPGYLHLTMRRAGAGASEHDLHQPVIEGNPHIALRVHRTVVRRALSDTQLASTLSPLLSAMIVGEVRTSDTGQPAYELKWSTDRNWIEIDYTPGKQTPGILAARN